MNAEFWAISFGVFLAGALYEGTGPLYIHFSERNCAITVGLISAVQAVCILTGIGTAITDIKYAPAYILGYAIGPIISIKTKHRWGR